jgi:predicted nucleotidyltransferase
MLDTVNLGNPFADAVPGARGRLLATAVQLERPVTVRALAQYAGISPQSALDIINDLADAGLFSAEHAGRALMVTLNRSHVLAEPLIAIAGARAQLVQRLTEALAAWPHLAGAWLFGSVARGDSDRHSDVDLLLVAEMSTDTDPWAADTGQLMDQVHSWTGNDAQLVEHTVESFTRLARTSNALIAAVRTDGIALTPNSRSLLRQAA